MARWGVERVILVDEHDEAVGTEEKLRAHAEGRLHRAFSIFLLNDREEILLQRRAAEKYHSGGLWSNTCCSHPRPDETVPGAAERRLLEEMGIECEMRPVSALVYRARVASGLWEHEYDHILIGRWAGDPAPDPAEVEAWRWIAIDELLRELRERPEAFTCWLRPALDELLCRGLVPQPGPN